MFSRFKRWKLVCTQTSFIITGVNYLSAACCSVHFCYFSISELASISGLTAKSGWSFQISANKSAGQAEALLCMTVWTQAGSSWVEAEWRIDNSVKNMKPNRRRQDAELCASSASSSSWWHLSSNCGNDSQVRKCQLVYIQRRRCRGKVTSWMKHFVYQVQRHEIEQRVRTVLGTGGRPRREKQERGVKWTRDTLSPTKTVCTSNIRDATD